MLSYLFPVRFLFDYGRTVYKDNRGEATLLATDYENIPVFFKGISFKFRKGCGLTITIKVRLDENCHQFYKAKSDYFGITTSAYIKYITDTYGGEKVLSLLTRYLSRGT